MKKSILFILLAMMTGISSFARDFTYTYEGQTLRYTVINETEKTVMVSKVIPVSPQNQPSGNLIIPNIAVDRNTEYSVTEISNNAFSGCRNLTSVTIPGTVTSIGNKAFYFCTMLDTINIPNSVVQIGDDAFLGCTPLKKVDFGSIESICSIKFSNKDSNPICYVQNLFVAGEKVSAVEIPDSIQSIGNYAFYGCNCIKSLTIHNSVTTIGDYAFYKSDSLTSVIFGKSISKIGDYAFFGCENIRKTIRPNTMKAIPYITNFGSQVYNPEGVIIEDGMVYGPEKKEILFAHASLSGEITISDSVTSIGEYAFHNCWEITSIVIPNSVVEIGMSVFNFCMNLESIYIGKSVKRIGPDAFWTCNNLNRAEFASVESLCSITFEGYQANPLNFAGNLYIDGAKVSDVIIPESVQSIGPFNFYNSNISSVRIGNSVTYIGSLAFYNCNYLTSVYIPNSVNEIRAWAFENCYNIKSVYYNTENPLECDCYVFTDETYANATLYVPNKSIDKARQVFPWKEFAKIEAYDFGGVNDIVADMQGDIDYSAPYEIYNFNGVKVGDNKESLAPGLYIIRQGSNTMKIAIQ